MTQARTAWHRAFDALDPDALRDRSNAKWGGVADDVLPLWVADMDFPVAPSIREAVAAYARNGDFGYAPEGGIPGVREACAARLTRRYGWEVRAEDVVPLAGIIPGLFRAVETFTAPGDEVLLPTPLYPWFERAVVRTGRTALAVDMPADADGRYRLDAGRMAERIGPATRMVMLCNPHNPTGRVFGRDELESVARMAVEHDLWIVSDELHADLVLDGTHTPIASLFPEVARRTITLYGPTKAFNVAGLSVGFAVAQDADVFGRMRAACHGPVPDPNVLAQAAARAAFADSDAWLEATLAYLDANRRLVAEVVRDRLPGVRHAPPEATYLAWLDFRGTPFGDAPAEILRERARVELNEGASFGAAGAGFARLNFATGRAIVAEALDRIARALERA